MNGSLYSCDPGIRNGTRPNSNGVSPTGCPVDQAELLRYLVETFETLSIRYMIGGAQAATFYGEPRLTRDIDVVAEIEPSHIPGLLDRFPGGDFYVSEEAVRGAIRDRPDAAEGCPGAESEPSARSELSAAAPRSIDSSAPRMGQARYCLVRPAARAVARSGAPDHQGENQHGPERAGRGHER